MTYGLSSPLVDQDARRFYFHTGAERISETCAKLHSTKLSTPTSSRKLLCNVFASYSRQAFHIASWTLHKSEYIGINITLFPFRIFAMFSVIVHNSVSWIFGSICIYTLFWTEYSISKWTGLYYRHNLHKTCISVWTNKFHNHSTPRTLTR